MFKFLQSKKGFTLVELLIVLVLLSFGAFAISNLVSASVRSFNKTEQRYERQEAAKIVAEFFQKNGSLSAATSVELYNTTAILPGENGETDTPDDKYNYIYVDTDTGYLYVWPAGEAKATQLTDIKLYITFDEIPYITSDNPDGDYSRSRGVKCLIAAVEDDFNYPEQQKPDKPGKTPEDTVPSIISDDIFYSLDVSYHFANMVENGSLYVNRTRTTGAYIKCKATNGSDSYTALDKGGTVVKYVSEITLSGDELMSESNLNLYCFVATASYGHDSGEVGLLCDFRDSVLMQSAPGRAFVKAYYTVSPPIAKVIAGSEPLKAAVRLALKPLVIVATFALDRDLLAANMAYIIILMITAAAAITVKVYCKHKRKKQ